ncbi:MAG: hypothetical protein V4664_01355 [Patescibacteria group bacterium]
MSVYAIFYVVFIASVSLASASALLCDAFFFISLRHRRIKLHESKNLQILSGISATSSLFSIVSLLCLMSLRISAGITPGEDVLVSIALLLAVAFLCSLTMRNVHLPSLKRHQHEYHHLSESFTNHQDSLLSASIVSTMSWLFIITIISADSRELIANTNFWNLIILYTLTTFLLSKIAVYMKKKVR